MIPAKSTRLQHQRYVTAILSGGGGIRTHGRFDPTAVFKTAPTPDASPRATRASRRMRKNPSLSLPYGPLEPTPELAEIMAAWPSLPEAIRAVILVMIRSASGKGG